MFKQNGRKHPILTFHNISQDHFKFSPISNSFEIYHMMNSSLINSDSMPHVSQVSPLTFPSLNVLIYKTKVLFALPDSLDSGEGDEKLF